MRATNKSILEMKVLALEKLPVPNEFKIEPEGFGKYIWISQDGKITPIKDFNDMHLFHTYKMLINTVLYAKDKAKHTILTPQMQAVVVQCNYHMHHIAYEYYLRQNIAEKASGKKYEIVKHIALKIEEIE